MVAHRWLQIKKVASRRSQLFGTSPSNTRLVVPRIVDRTNLVYYRVETPSAEDEHLLMFLHSSVWVAKHNAAGYDSLWNGCLTSDNDYRRLFRLAGKSNKVAVGDKC